MTYITLWVPPLVTKVLWAHWSMFVLCRNPFVSWQHSILIVGWLTSITSFVSPQNCLFLKRPPRVIQYRSYKNFVDELFISDLFILSHTMMYCDYDINMCIDFFVTHLNVIIDKHAPLKYKKVRQNNVPHMNSELRKLNYQRNMLRNVKNKHPCPANFERYRMLRNLCVKAKLKSQRQYFSKRCQWRRVKQSTFLAHFQTFYQF